MTLVVLLPVALGFLHAGTRPVISRRTAVSMEGGLFGRFRAKREVEAAEQIAVGAPLPAVEIEAILFDVSPEEGEDEPSNVGADVKAAVLPVAKALGNGTTVLVGMPGAFTPTCSDRHLPGFVEKSEELKDLGVTRVAVLTTNDRYVNSAWNKAIEKCMVRKSDLLMLSDADGDLVKQLGLVDDMGFGLGLRSKRFVIVAEDGVVQHVLTDDGTEQLEETSAEKVIELLTPTPVSLPTGLSSADSGAAVGVAVVVAAVGGLYYLYSTGALGDAGAV